MSVLSVREHARIGISAGAAYQHDMDTAWVSSAAFSWLCDEFERLCTGGARLQQRGGQRWLQLDSYVGVLECPDGTVVEILPKHLASPSSAVAARRLLKAMLSAVLDLDPRESAPTGLALFDVPLNEWVMGRFLLALEHLLKRGLRFEYGRVAEEQPFLRGQLRMAAQMRQPPSRAHLFHVEHDVFSADRAENRLLRTALDRVCKRTRHPGNWRLAHELSARLASLPRSRQVAADLRAWQQDRLMAHYRGLRPLCALILSGQSPLALVGEWDSPSLLFPMERLFERYVAHCLGRQFAPAWQRVAPATAHLCEHEQRGWFALRPDMVFSNGQTLCVVDAKWKLLDTDEGATRRGYGLRQGDVYQMFAYGHRHAQGRGDLLLVYPMHAGFTAPLPPFAFDEQLRLHVAPLDLASGRLQLPLDWQGMPPSPD